MPHSCYAEDCVFSFFLNLVHGSTGATGATVGLGRETHWLAHRRALAESNHHMTACLTFAATITCKQRN